MYCPGTNTTPTRIYPTSAALHIRSSDFEYDFTGKCYGAQYAHGEGKEEERQPYVEAPGGGVTYKALHLGDLLLVDKHELGCLCAYGCHPSQSLQQSVNTQLLELKGSCGI
eukprot:comp19461_c0_seq1/m.22641 comp19461_c0_seq1/g.22641  ORF comp19461_c0_seq1/g.22641 comp19461_c0_seq1/m.22641 type:complete len:111 (+) comp19461_c0_seq1:292-624(+)